MLHSYAFSNFRSFRERVEVSLALTDKDAVNGWARESPITGQRLSTAIAVLGGNASGKTSLIQPLAFLAWFVRYSFGSAIDAPVPIDPHFNGRDLPIEFEVTADALEPETLLRYRLSVAAGLVSAESLETKLRRGQWQAIFRRERTKEGKYSVAQDRFGMDQTQADSVRPNVSLISWAAQFAVPLAQQLVSFQFGTNMFSRYWQPHHESIQRCTDFYARNPQTRERMVSLLQQWDLGISDVALHEIEIPDQTGERKKQWFAFGVHRDAENNLYTLPFVQESSGTLSAFELLALLLPALEQGGSLPVMNSIAICTQTYFRRYWRCSLTRTRTRTERRLSSHATLWRSCDSYRNRRSCWLRRTDSRATPGDSMRSMACAAMTIAWRSTSPAPTAASRGYEGPPHPYHPHASLRRRCG